MEIKFDTVYINCKVNTFLVNDDPLFEGGLLIKTFDLDIKNINWKVDTFEVNNSPCKADEIDVNEEIYDKDWKPFLGTMVMDELPPGPFYESWTSMDKFAPSCMKSQIASELKATLTLGESPCHSISVMPFLSFQHIYNKTGRKYTIWT